MNRTIPLIALLLVACAPATPDQPTSVSAAALSPCSPDPTAATRFTRGQLNAAVDPVAAVAIREQNVVGLSVGIAHRGEPIYVQGFGMADRADGKPATGDTQYDVGSIAKTFTAVALLQFAERGLLDLDDPVSRHLPDYDGPMAGATLRHLLSHTSGFRGGPEIDETKRQPELERPLTRAGLLALPAVTQARAEFPPGTTYHYLNSGFHLLRVVADAVAGREYAEYVADQILHPAGMADAVAAEWPTGEHAAVPYMWQEGRFVRPPPIHVSIYPAIIASVRDLLSFQCALDAGRLLRPASVALMRAPTLIRDGPDSLWVPYGLGIMRGPPEARQVLGHQGTWPGGSAHLAHYPDEGVTIAVLTNTNGPGVAQAREIAPKIAHALLGGTTRGLSSTPMPVDEEFARIATGRFQWHGFVNEVTWEDGELRVRDPATGDLWGRLLRVGPLATTFVAAEVQWAEGLPAYRLSDPPYELSLHSPSGNHVLWFREGGMFWDVGVRHGARRPVESR